MDLVIRFGDMVMTLVLYLVAASGLLAVSVMGQGLAMVVAMLIVLEGADLARRVLWPGASFR
jgi:hypothetical protein